MAKMRVQAKFENGKTQVKALITHPMETGQRKDSKTGKIVPAHYIDEIICEYNGEIVMKSLWSGGISKNPYLSFTFEGGAAGEKIKLSWTDHNENEGAQSESDAMEVEIKG